MSAKSQPAWSFRPKLKYPKSPHSPGPGAYHGNRQKVLVQTPNFTISRSQRFGQSAHQPSLGPGSYQTTGNLLKTSGDIGKANKSQTRLKFTTPGPGKYQASNSFLGPKFTMQGRPQRKIQKQSPGPGQYSYKSTNELKTNKFANSQRAVSVHSNLKVPGPGTYNLDSQLNSTFGKIGNQQRDAKLLQSVPGPGTYQIPSSLDNKAYSMSAKKLSPKTFQVPGPGTYEASSTFDNRSYSVGRAGRFKGSTLDQPGPSTYRCTTSHMHSPARPVFGNSSREKLYSVPKTPGPGRYEVRYPQESVKGGLIETRYRRNPDHNPGPGHYGWKKSTRTPIEYSFPKAKSGLQVKGGIDGVGPGQYNVDTSTLDVTDWRFKTSERWNYRENFQVGPGSYEIKSLIGNIPAYAAK